MGESVFATAYCFSRDQAGKIVATLAVDVQIRSAAVADKCIGAYDCPNWDKSGAAKVVFLPQHLSKPDLVGPETLMISHDGLGCVKVFGLIPRQTDMCNATFESVLDDFRVHGGTYADEVVRNRFSHGAASIFALATAPAPAI